MWTETSVGGAPLGTPETVASLGDGERTGRSVWHCHGPAAPRGASHHPFLDLGNGAVIPQFFKIIKSYSASGGRSVGSVPGAKESFTCGHGSTHTKTAATVGEIIASSCSPPWRAHTRGVSCVQSNQGLVPLGWSDLGSGDH